MFIDIFKEVQLFAKLSKIPPFSMYGFSNKLAGVYYATLL